MAETKTNVLNQTRFLERNACKVDDYYFPTEGTQRISTEMSKVLREVKVYLGGTLPPSLRWEWGKTPYTNTEDVSNHLRHLLDGDLPTSP